MYVSTCPRIRSDTVEQGLGIVFAAFTQVSYNKGFGYHVSEFLAAGRFQTLLMVLKHTQLAVASDCTSRMAARIAFSLSTSL